MHARMMGQRERALDVDRRQFVERRLVDVRDQVPDEHARVVDDDVQLAVLLDRPVHQRAHRRPVGDRRGVDGCAAAGGRDLLGDRLRRRHGGRVRDSVVDDHGRPRGGERERVLTPEPGARTRDDRHLAIKRTHLTSPPSWFLPGARARPRASAPTARGRAAPGYARASSGTSPRPRLARSRRCAPGP